MRGPKLEACGCESQSAKTARRELSQSVIARQKIDRADTASDSVQRVSFALPKYAPAPPGLGCLRATV